MSDRKYALATSLLVMLALNAWAQPGFKDLKVQLKLDQERCLSGERVWVEVRVSNPDTILLTAWLSPRLVSVSGVQVFSSDGKEIATHCWDPRINTPVTLAMPPRKTGFLGRLELTQCFGDDPDRVFPPGRYGVRARFTTVNGDQGISDSVSFAVAEPEGAEKELYRRILKTKDRAKLEKLFRKNPQSAYASLLAMRYFSVAFPHGGKQVLLRGIEFCESLIAQGPDRVRSAVLVDSIAALSGRLAGAGRARKSLRDLIARYPKTEAAEEAEAALSRLEEETPGGSP